MNLENKYKPGDFGYWWTVEEKNIDVDGKEYQGRIWCSDKLTSLKGAPKKVVKGGFICGSGVSLTSLEGAPKEIGGYFNCENCKNLSKEEIMRLRDYCDIKGKIISDYGEF